VLLDASLTSRAAEEHGVPAPSPGAPSSGILKDPLIAALMRQLCHSIEHPTTSDTLFADAAAELLAVQLLRDHARTSGWDLRDHDRFASQAHFATRFRLATGMTPTAFRRLR